MILTSGKDIKASGIWSIVELKISFRISGKCQSQKKYLVLHVHMVPFLKYLTFYRMTWYFNFFLFCFGFEGLLQSFQANPFAAKTLK